MPTYLYECDNCGRFEEFQKITDEPLAECPECGSPVKRIIGGAPGVIFKGSGFYVTDTRSTNSATAKNNNDSGKKDIKKEEKAS